MVKPTILLVLVVTIIGYIFCIRCHLTNPKFCKSDGYHTFLNSAVWGAIWMLIATLTFWSYLSFLKYVGWSDGIVLGWLKSIVQTVFPSSTFSLNNLHLVQISILAFLFAFFIPNVLMSLATWLTGKSKRFVQAMAFKKIAHSDDSPEFTSIYYQSWDFGLPIAFTMSNGKVYIGYAFEGGQHLNDILVVPLRSGYRSEEEKRLEIVTNYEPVWEELESNEENQNGMDLSKFYICLPVREIMHANLHDFGYREVFSKYEKEKVEKTNKYKEPLLTVIADALRNVAKRG
ncbi:hypothetical protein J8M21_19055 [Pseudoalteromonas luteoviolacea]|uniref:hypothetical protein n=1 Tax=Pseudoalteromonas luteoviolacea TaxID=43657 RepID=UPI001B39EB15|nr:hypothetical protein [Pseudoalteromonas luteoviolacea]MBQ4879315.1 hypothetical protein [Pseudoalteromonas luteoviolacea]MBQ4908375.1 hypothetical protein [Pseudoalteromonas luteoviolacea]